MTTFDLWGRNAIITGGAKGIGLGIAKRLADSGASVTAWDLETSSLMHGPEKSAFSAFETVDVRNPESVGKAIDSTLERFGHIDILVNNAGVNGPTVPMWEYPIEAWQKVLDTDLTGVFMCCRAVVPAMRSAGYGRIVNIASVAGKEGNANACAYSAAKAGVIALTKSLGKELAQDGIVVNCVTPAMVKTDLLKEMTPEYIRGVKAKIPMGRFGTIKENADMVAWLCSDECSFTTGGVFDVSGGRATY